MNYRRMIKFQIVGWGGSLINLGSLWLLHGQVDLPLLLAGALGIEASIIHNFTWHYWKTWRDRVQGNLVDYGRQLLRYNIVTASIDFIMKLVILWGLTRLGIHYLLAAFISLLFGPVFKYLANEFIIFRPTDREGKPLPSDLTD